MRILDGKKTAEQVRQEIKKEVATWVDKGNRPPHLAAVLVGDNGASQTYVNAKIKDCEEVGFKSSLIKLSDTITEKELLEKIDELNSDESLDGYIVQLPLPKHINEKKITQAISPTKDVDGFHPENLGKMVLNLPTFLPATPYGIMQLLEYYSIDTSGKNCVVVGRSNIVGTPVSILMSRNNDPGNATVTLAHSRTQNLEALIKTADILIVALGKPDFIKGDMVKEGAVIIDVGITRVTDSSRKKGYRVAGDVHFESVKKKASFITPVPGGVGPMTRVSLLKNTLLACKRKA
ncbi:bifunctional methylenetetrahydrofolate dehydrogenase/methenyltetrahydrofolate cyclohydrolase FolD [Luteibaculum oceani]|uniref:Bifunctional protein FolD n=1 Tax=Luteibaculum oceani TaxID=1294296 RepID=A0A5C6VAX1_9FLAO|nr:bifunctional methylenetetrahydrofolate dehydrogenase/methenyltetrahydrofolate cyclohydrolase FolD [Luteibaculum oceani]TXC81994.1 bifunctional methylenetetrahydrofolate dehydrogenase/methenyltetrahydrofolate cyclohydrolase FolD [Luteibaculum oceani]